MQRVKIKENLMKKEIHPQYVECTVTCACGNTFTTMSNKKEMKIDICSACHPFFTGSEKIVDSAGRVEKFKKKYNMK
jgi:large subunit ribosomal protein L31